VSITHSTQVGSIASAAVAGRLGRRLLGSSLVLAVVLCVVGVAPASAASKYVHRVVAPPPGVSSPGPLEVQFGPNAPTDIAINSSAVSDGATDPLGDPVDGYAYVVDVENNRVQVFDSDGVFQFMFGAGVRNGLPVGQTCDRTETPCQAGIAGEVGGAFKDPQGVVIDQTSGHVFVRELTKANGNLRVQEFTGGGVFVRAWGWDVVKEGTTNDTPTDQFETCRTAADCQGGVSGSGLGQFLAGTLGYGGGIDLHAPSGDVVVADPAALRVQRFDVPANPADPVVPVSTCGPIPGFAAVRLSPNAGLNIAVAVDDAGIVYAPGVDDATVVRCDLSSGPPELIAPIPLASVAASQPTAGVVGLDVDPATDNLLVAMNGSVADQPSYSPVFELSNPDGPVGSISSVDTHVVGSGLVWNGLGLDSDSGELYLASSGLLLAANDGAAAPASVSFSPYSGVTSDGATVNLTVDAGDLLGASYRVQVARSSDPDDFETVASGVAERGLGFVSVAVPLSDLRPGTLYLVRVVSRRDYGNPEVVANGPVLLTVVPKPSVNAVDAVAVEDTGARLVGRVNPHGTQTRYRFEWGRDGFEHVVPLPDGLVGSGYEFEFVSQALSGLTPDTTYRYRLVATSDSEGATVGATKTFTTRPAATASAERAYELVSPPDKLGGTGVGEWYRGPASLASAGVAAYEGERFAAQGSFGSMLFESPFAYANDWSFADRVDSQKGWVGHSPVTRPNLGTAFASFLSLVATSEDLSRLVTISNNTMLLFPELTGPGWNQKWSIPYWISWGGSGSGPRWEFFGPNDRTLVDAPTDAVWRVVLSDDGSRAVGLPRITAGGIASVRGMAGPGDPTRASFGDLAAGRSVYAANTAGEPSDVFATGARVLVNVCSGVAGVNRTVLPVVNGSGDMTGAECPAALAGRDGRLVSERGASLYGSPGSNVAPPEDMVSGDGRRVFFLSPDPAAAGVPDGISTFCSIAGQTCPAQLFVRQENADGSFTTRWISRSKVVGQDARLTGTVRFEGATHDGDKVLFRTNSPLTADDPNGAGLPIPAGGVKDGAASNDSWDLYLYDFPDDQSADPGSGSLTRVSAGPTAGGDCSSPYAGDPKVDTTGALRFMSSDASRVYFTCVKPLAGASTTEDSITAPASGSSPNTETNLYVYDASLPVTSGRWRFVARLPRSTSVGLDVCASTGRTPQSPFSAQAQDAQFRMTSSNANCVRGSSDGGLVTWFTSGRLTADDPIGAGTGDVYAFDADEARLVRVSASQGGVGGSYLCAPQGGSTARCHADGGVDSSNVDVGPLNPILGVATDPLLDGDRVAFFQSAVRLVAADTDESYDVYQWRSGELSLLTSGTADHALYVGNDRSGRNVFVASRDRLSWQDVDSVGDVYTVRVGGGIAEPPPPPVCSVLADLCRPDGAAATPAMAGSAGPGGGGNADSSPDRARPVLAVEPPSAVARRRAARSGVLRLGVRVTGAPMRLRVIATAKIAVRGRRASRRIGTATTTVRRAGEATVALRLSGAARRQLRRSGRLVVAVKVSSSGRARPGSAMVVLRRAGR
jgi:hypothetical protein